MRNNYNFIAPYYDFISRLVFGKAIVGAQNSLLPYIPANSDVLIVGGGSGWILEELARLHTSGLNITYLDNSTGMIALAKKRNYGNNTVAFVCEAVEQYETNKKFDCIYTPFLFDNFKSEKAAFVFEKLHRLLKPGRYWLYTDFIPTQNTKNYWQKILLSLMYFFFTTVSKIETKELVDMDPLFQIHGYTLTFTSWHYKRFIRSMAYKKTVTDLL